MLFLSFHRAFCRVFNYTLQPMKTHTHTYTHTHTHTYIYICIYYLRSLKFTLKHLKPSYMFRSHDHPQGAYIFFAKIII